MLYRYRKMWCECQWDNSPSKKYNCLQHKKNFWFFYAIYYYSPCSVERSTSPSHKTEVFSIKMGIVDTNFLFWDTIIHILLRITLNLPENILKMILLKCWTFWSTIYLLSLEDLYFNRQSVFQWVLIVHPCWLIYFCTRMKQNSFRTF